MCAIIEIFGKHTKMILESAEFTTNPEPYFLTHIPRALFDGALESWRKPRHRVNP